MEWGPAWFFWGTLCWSVWWACTWIRAGGATHSKASSQLPGLQILWVPGMFFQSLLEIFTKQPATEGSLHPLPCNTQQARLISWLYALAPGMPGCLPSTEAGKEDETLNQDPPSQSRFLPSILQLFSHVGKKKHWADVIGTSANISWIFSYSSLILGRSTKTPSITSSLWPSQKPGPLSTTYCLLAMV